MTQHPKNSERLQKVLAAAGLGSRRMVEEWIRAERLAVNGRTAKLGDRASPGDEILLDGKRLALPAAEASTRQLIVYNKPLDEVTTRNDPQGRRTVFASLPPAGAGRWISIGRLDINTSGLLLFTTDGELAHRLMHPSSEVEREYLVTVRGRPQADVLETLRSGVMLEDGSARFDSIEPTQNPGPDAAFKVILREGRNREVRRMWMAVGHEVVRLARTRYGPFELPPDLPSGQWRAIPIEAVDSVGARSGSAVAKQPGGPNT